MTFNRFMFICAATNSVITSGIAASAIMPGAAMLMRSGRG